MGRVIAVYPGTFDPPTNGHQELIFRASMLFDKLYIMIGKNPKKPNRLLSVDECIAYFNDLIEETGNNAEVVAYEGATVDFCRSVNATCIVRGFRSVMDFEYERAIADVNSKLHLLLQTIFINLPGQTDVSSSVVRELYDLNKMQEIGHFTSQAMMEILMKKKGWTYDDIKGWHDE